MSPISKPKTARFQPLMRRGILSAFLLSIVATTSCGESEARLQMEAVAAATAREAKAEAAALMASTKAGIEAAKAEQESQQEKLGETREAVENALGEAIEVAGQLFGGTRDDLIATVEEQLASSSAQIAALETKLAEASSDAQAQMQLHLAALKSKRSLAETRLARVVDAADDAWQALAPALEESLSSVAKSILTTEEKFDTALQTSGPTGGDWFPGKPAELFDVVKVVDGDTIHIMRNGEKQKLRLLSVDTEEKLSGRAFNASKPETLFGEETKLWAIDYFNGLANEEGVIQVGVAFPEGEEAFDVYGRLLCHVVLPDGSDFNLKLVEEGWSPYFTKYGYSRICHESFAKAEAAAQAKQLGIWNPDVNKPASSSEPWNKRDYDRALPWWRARGDAIRAFRQRHKALPDSIVSAEDEAGLTSLEATGKVSDYPKTVFGAVDRVFEESDGSLTLLFRASKDQRAFRAKISAELRPKLASLDLKNRGGEGVQNYLFVSGKVVNGPRGFDINLTTEQALTLAAPDPVYPEEE